MNVDDLTDLERALFIARYSHHIDREHAPVALRLALEDVAEFRAALKGHQS